MSKYILPALLLLLLVVPTDAPTAREPVVVYADPSENPNLTDQQRSRIVNSWLYCAECVASDVKRVSAFGNKVLDDLEKAYKGNARFLRLEAQAALFSSAYDAFSPKLSGPSDKDAFVKREIAKLKRRVSARAEAALIDIGTPEALAILGYPDRGRIPG